MQKNNYKIIRLEQNKDGTIQKIVLKTFFAKNNSEAFKYLKSYKAIANKEYKYYFDKINIITVIGKNGKKYKYDSSSEFFNRHDDMTFFEKLWFNITCELRYWFITKPYDFVYFIRDLIYFIKHKQYYRASWSLDSYLLDTIEHNVKILMKTKHGISLDYCDAARIKLHSNDKDFDIKKYNADHYDYTDEETKLATELELKNFNDLLLTIKLYKYYYDYGIVNHNNKEEHEFDKKWRSTIPVVPGTYDMFEYDQLDRLIKKQWNKIWAWIAKYGQGLWD